MFGTLPDRVEASEKVPGSKRRFVERLLSGCLPSQQLRHDDHCSTRRLTYLG